MNTYPPEPNAGDKISATLIRDIIRCLRRITPIAGPGVRQRITPNGTFLSADGGSATVAAASYRNECWNIGSQTVQGEDAPVLAFINRYYMFGGMIHEMPYGENVRLDNFVMKGELEENQEYTDDDLPYVGLVVTMQQDSPTDPPPGSASVTGFKEWADLVSTSNDRHAYVRPLYKLTHEGAVVMDFRNIIQFASYEIESSPELSQ